MTIHEQERHTILSFIHVVNCLTVIFIHKSLVNRKNPHHFLLHYARCIDVVYCVWYLSPLRAQIPHIVPQCAVRRLTTHPNQVTLRLCEIRWACPQVHSNTNSFLSLPVVYFVLQKTSEVENNLL